ncbi:MAG: Arc family DNA-binding protein [Ruthenibacterium sp.]
MTSVAQLKAVAKHQDKLDDIKIRVPKDGTRERYKKQAAAHGKSLNSYIIELIEKDAKKSPSVT